MANTSRRSFIAKTALGITGLSLSKVAVAGKFKEEQNYPVVISAWRHGIYSNDIAWKILSDGGYALDAVEAGVRELESDPEVMVAGHGGFPDANGKVTLDACVMNEKGDAGSVANIQCIRNPVSVARLVMETTPHVMLSGKGAQKFALENGFRKEKLLTKDMRRRWKAWTKDDQDFSSETHPENMPEEGQETISMLAIDEKGRLCGACTTSGMAYQLHGRVGASPIIGAGLFVDGEVGGSAAAGAGELVMKTFGSFLVVEFMRNGMTPGEACNAVIARIVKKMPDYESHQVGFIAVNKSGVTGAASLHPGFEYAVKSSGVSGLKEAGSWFKRL